MQFSFSFNEDQTCLRNASSLEASNSRRQTPSVDIWKLSRCHCWIIVKIRQIYQNYLLFYTCLCTPLPRTRRILGFFERLRQTQLVDGSFKGYRFNWHLKFAYPLQCQLYDDRLKCKTINSKYLVVDSWLADKNIRYLCFNSKVYGALNSS